MKTSTFSKAEKIEEKKKANTLKNFFKASLIKFLLLKAKPTFTSGIKGERTCSVAVRMLLNMRYKHIEDCCTTSCSSQPSLKLSSCSSQNDDNISK